MTHDLELMEEEVVVAEIHEKKISNDKKDIHSGGYGYGVKIKIKHINGEEVEECFDKNHNKLHNYTITPFNDYQM